VRAGGIGSSTDVAGVELSCGGPVLFRVAGNKLLPRAPGSRDSVTKSPIFWDFFDHALKIAAWVLDEQDAASSCSPTGGELGVKLRNGKSK
jgi:hypothetical protein